MRRKHAEQAVLVFLCMVLAGVAVARWDVWVGNYRYLTGQRAAFGPELFEEAGRTYIRDVDGVRFDITDAIAMGFETSLFNHGIGRDTIAPVMEPELAGPEHERYQSFGRERQVLGVSRGGESRAYPIDLLRYHEIVNDMIGEIACAACYCPLAGLGAVYSRETGEGTVTLGTSGWTYNSTFVIYDHQTDNLWFPVRDGLLSIGGGMRGETLPEIEHERTTWGEWLSAHPGSLLCVGGELAERPPVPTPAAPPAPAAADLSGFGGSGSFR